MTIKLTQSELDVCQYEGTIGFCETCGFEHEGVEPDAHGYTCSACGAPTVTGFEDLLLQGQIEVI
jgi:hypothetical protein